MTTFVSPTGAEIKAEVILYLGQCELTGDFNVEAGEDPSQDVFQPFESSEEMDVRGWIDDEYEIWLFKHLIPDDAQLPTEDAVEAMRVEADTARIRGALLRAREIAEGYDNIIGHIDAALAA